MADFIRKIAPVFLVRIYHYSLAIAGAVFYWFPSRNLKVIGITGTSGKSTTTELLSCILEKAGHKTASLSSVRFKIGQKEEKNMLKMTMPGRFKIQKFLMKAVNEKCEYAVIEVTSQGIEQFRHKFINFESAVFTNLSPEHVEAHKGFENYKKAKAKLFYTAKNIHVINRGDPNSDFFWNIPAKTKIGFSLKEDSNLLSPINLIGEFNKYNALAAIKTAMALGIPLDICQKAIHEFKGIPGRMEVIAENPFSVIVDYAHTPEQLKQVYQSFNRPKICVLGSCGGGRDKWKRLEMGKLAREYCKQIIITNEDPYDENPMEIIDQIKKGAGEEAQVILDRKEAIKKAIRSAEKDDVVIITGKGSEPWMCLAKGKKIPWDDREVAKKELLSKQF